jgi:hypothetical protein
MPFPWEIICKDVTHKNLYKFLHGKAWKSVWQLKQNVQQFFVWPDLCWRRRKSMTCLIDSYKFTYVYTESVLFNYVQNSKTMEEVHKDIKYH